jgi:hypothetical protein
MIRLEVKNNIIARIFAKLIISLRERIMNLLEKKEGSFEKIFIIIILIIFLNNINKIF